MQWCLLYDAKWQDNDRPTHHRHHELAVAIVGPVSVGIIVDEHCTAVSMDGGN
jgi:hypothetical protein